MATQLPQKIHASLTGQATELVCFRLAERLALGTVAALGADPAAVAALPLGAWISYGRLTGSQLAGRVF